MPPSPACPKCQPCPRADTAIQERPDPACPPPHSSSFGAGTRRGLRYGGLTEGGLHPSQPWWTPPAAFKVGPRRCAGLVPSSARHV